MRKSPARPLPNGRGPANPTPPGQVPNRLRPHGQRIGSPVTSAIAVGALVDARDRSIDLGDELARSGRAPELDQAVFRLEESDRRGPGGSRSTSATRVFRLAGEAISFFHWSACADSTPLPLVHGPLVAWAVSLVDLDHFSILGPSRLARFPPPLGGLSACRKVESAGRPTQMRRGKIRGGKVSKRRSLSSRDLRGGIRGAEIGLNGQDLPALSERRRLPSTKRRHRRERIAANALRGYRRRLLRSRPLRHGPVIDLLRTQATAAAVFLLVPSAGARGSARWLLGARSRAGLGASLASAKPCADTQAPRRPRRGDRRAPELAQLGACRAACLEFGSAISCPRR